MILSLRLLFCAWTLLIASCSPAPELKLSILTAVSSPSSKRELLIVRQDPGALGLSSKAVFVRNKGDHDFGKRVFVTKGETKLEARWLSEERVVITHDARKEDVFHSSNGEGIVGISYQPLEKPDTLESLRKLGQR